MDVEDSSLKSFFNIFLYLRDLEVVFLSEALEDYSELSDAFFFLFYKLFGIFDIKIIPYNPGTFCSWFILGWYWDVSFVYLLPLPGNKKPDWIRTWLN